MRIPNDPHILIQEWSPERRDPWYTAVEENQEAIKKHLEECPNCREKAADLVLVVLLPDKLKQRLLADMSEDTEDQD